LPPLQIIPCPDVLLTEARWLHFLRLLSVPTASFYSYTCLILRSSNYDNDKQNFSLNLRTLLGFVSASLATLFLTAQAQQAPHNPLTLDQCNALSLQNNPQLLSSQYAVAESEERVQEMRAAYFPTLSLTSVATRYSSASGKNSGETFTSNNYDAGLSARYYLFQGFKTVAATDAALFNYDALTYQHESNRQDLILKIAQAYYKLVQAERLIRVAEKSVERARLHLEAQPRTPCLQEDRIGVLCNLTPLLEDPLR